MASPGPSEQRPFLSEWQPRSAPAPDPSGGDWPTAENTDVTITVRADALLAPVSPALFGNNVAVWTPDAYYFDATALERLRAVQVSMLRYPGGSTSNHWHFDGDYPPEASEHAWLNDGWTTDFSDFVRLLDEVGGARPMLTVNYGYVHYGDVQRAAQLAADWVEYCNGPDDGSNPGGGIDWAARRNADGFAAPLGFRYWEIGNEIYGNWEVGHEPDGSIYAANWNVIRDAMKAIDPDVHVGLIATDESWWDQSWAASVLGHRRDDGRITGDLADFLIVHDYFTQDPATDQVLPSAEQVHDNTAFLDELLGRHTSRAPGDVAYTLTEYNTSLHDQVATPNFLVGGMFIGKILGMLAKDGWSAATFWDVANGWSGAGDHGLLSKDHDGLDQFTPYPAYFAFYFYAQAFGDTLVEASSDDDSVVVHASRYSDGTLGLILINEGGNERGIRLDTPGRTPPGEANAWTLTGEALDSGRLALNGESTGREFGGPDPTQVPPRYLALDADVPLTLELPGHSMTALRVY